MSFQQLLFIFTVHFLIHCTSSVTDPVFPSIMMFYPTWEFLLLIHNKAVFNYRFSNLALTNTNAAIFPFLWNRNECRSHKKGLPHKGLLCINISWVRTLSYEIQLLFSFQIFFKTCCFCIFTKELGSFWAQYSKGRFLKKIFEEFLLNCSLKKKPKHLNEKFVLHQIPFLDFKEGQNDCFIYFLDLFKVLLHLGQINSSSSFLFIFFPIIVQDGC